MSNEEVERLDERPEGGAELLVASTEQDDTASAGRPESELLRQPRLADPRFPRQQDNRGTATFGATKGLLKALSFGVAANQARWCRRCEHRRQRQRAPPLQVPLDRCDGHRVQALERELADQPEPVLGLVAGHEAHQVGRKDLTGLRRLAEPGCLDD